MPEWWEEYQQPLTADGVEIDTTELTPLPGFEYCDEPTFDDAADPEVNTHIRLDGDLSFPRRPARRFLIDYRSNSDAYKHLETMPELGDDVEMIISGRYAMWELVPALIERTGQAIAELTIATLSFSKPNAVDLLALMDTGHVAAVNLLISYYFKSTSRDIYDSLIPELRARGHRVLAMRTHMKVILARLTDGRCFIFRGSPNLRSSVNVESLTATQCPKLYDFYFQIIDGLIREGKELGGSQ